MFAFIGAINMSLVFIGGALYAIQPVLGMIISGIGAACMGALFAAVRVQGFQVSKSGLSTIGGIRIMDIVNFVETPDLTRDVYVSHQGRFSPIGEMFLCKMHGKPALVFEPFHEETS